ncbi:MAG: dihydrolipoyl dehydrogenase [Proteobacteria bacterium]|nr:dihydrolipoyl dehydrogenase [Pseudomonadota bacterium]
MNMYDVVILGAGPGGYVCAIRAAQLGLKVAIVESTHLGGVCLNYGCIPTKALLKSAELLRSIQHASDFGLDVTLNGFSLEKIVERSRKISNQLSSGILGLLKKNKITHIEGFGVFKNATTLKVTKADQSTETITAKKIVIATGAKSREMPSLKADGERIWLARHAMMPSFLPKTLLVIGSGAIGMEFASFYTALGVEVTVVELCEDILPQEDKEISKLALKAFQQQGMKFKLKSTVESLINEKTHVKALIQNLDNKEEMTFDAAIVAIGIVGNTDNIGLQNTKVIAEKNQIKINGYCQTNDPSIYAIGDVVGAPWLAHKASHEGIIAAEHIKGLDVHPLDKTKIPGCTYTYPQVASVGLTEEKAKSLNLDVKVGKFPFKANGKALTLGENDGLIKTVFDAKTGELLGAHMIGVDVTELIQGYVIAKNLETTEKELMETIFPHPTLSEMMHEAVLNAYGQTIHF